MTILIATGALIGDLANAAMAEDLPYCQQGQALFGEGDYSAAISKINQCISEGDLSVESRACAVLNRARCYLAMRQQDKASGDVGSAITRDPSLEEIETAAACLGASEIEAKRLLKLADID